MIPKALVREKCTKAIGPALDAALKSRNSPSNRMAPALYTAVIAIARDETIVLVVEDAEISKRYYLF